MVINSNNDAKQYEKELDFAASITHELKTPLTSIIGFMEFLKKNDGKDKKTREYLYNIIDSEAHRLLSMIDDILLLSQMQRGGKAGVSEQKCNVSKEIQTVTKMLSSLASSKNVDIFLNIDERLNVGLPSMRLQRLFSNLIGNAIKYNVKNGKIFVNAYLKGNSAVINVKDTGIGIDSEHINKIFDKFYRVNSKHTEDISGNGLGLAIVRDIVNLYGGSIHVDSELGKGSEFIVSLPACN